MRKILTMFSLVFIISTLLMGCQVSDFSKDENVNVNQNQTDKTPQSESITNYYKVIYNADKSYTIILYDKNKNVVHKETVFKEPYIGLEDENIIKIVNSVGSSANYTYFYDVASSKISPVYENAILIQKDKIVFMKNDVLIVSNIFNKSLFYKEIKRNFSPTAVPSSAIISAKFINSNKLQIDYYTGKNFTEKLETINLDELP